MVHGSARDEMGDRGGIRDGDAKISKQARHGGTGRHDYRVCLNELPTLGCHAHYRVGLASDGALPCLGDELPAAFHEVLDQELDEARQVDPSLARIPDGTGIRDGRRIHTWSVSADVLRPEQVAVVTVSHLMIMTSAQLLNHVLGIPSQPARKPQPTKTGLQG